MSETLSCAEQVQVQNNYKTHAYKTPETACVQTIMLQHPTELKDGFLKKIYAPIKRRNR